MRVFHRIEEVLQAEESNHKRSAVALGNFDGVHAGHAALIRDMLKVAGEMGSMPSVLTFFPHPVEVLRPGTKLERLTTASEKLAILSSLGVETVLVAKFDAELASLSPEQFFERYLDRGFHASSVHVGFNFSFGRARAGNIDTLTALCHKSSIRLQVEQPITARGQKVSSSRIREFIRVGDVTAASECLGRPYSVSGLVCQGDGRGRQLGFATANLRVAAEKLLPKNGVYVTRAWWQKQPFLSVTNIGVRPTFARSDELATHIETHLLDFNSRIYDEEVTIDFLERLRDEAKFASAQSLKSQIEQDIVAARESLSLRSPKG